MTQHTDSRAVRTSLRAAAVKVDITPADLTGLHPVGGGSFVGVHDRIFMRTLLIADGESEVAIISLDLIEAGDMAPIRQRIELELGIPADHVLICATHTHSAPRLGEVSPGAIAHELSPKGVIYTAWVYDQMLDSLTRARAALRPARIGVGSGSVDINVNRDQYVAGEYRIGVNPDGPSDKTLWLVDVETPDGDPIAVLIAYAVHPTLTLGTRLISGDLAGAAERHVEERIGGGVVALWAAGAVGDQQARVLAPRVPLNESPEGRDHSLAFELAAAQGVVVGAEAVRVRGAITRFTASARISAREVIADLPARHRQTDDMPTIKQQRVETVRLRLAVVVIGTLALAGVGGEVVTKIGLRARASSPLANTILLSLVNDRLGYIPDDASYPQNTFEVRGSPIQPGYAERAIVDGAVDTIETLLHAAPRQ
jgi:Neutral/alkaline non-lysosomal ceramidase, N-terminal